jgi:hypothetical protein
MFTMDELMAMAFDRSSAVLDHLDHEGLAAGHVEGIHDALHHTESQQPVNRDVARQRQAGQRQRLHHRQRLRPHQNLAAIQAVHPYAGEGCKQKGGNLPRKADRAQQQRRSRQPVDQPTGGDARHPRADQRNALTAKEEPEVAMPQRAPRMRSAAVDARFRSAEGLGRSCAGCFVRDAQDCFLIRSLSCRVLQDQLTSPSSRSRKA